MAAGLVLVLVRSILGNSGGEEIDVNRTFNLTFLTLIRSKCSLVAKKTCGYRVTHLVVYLGWVDFDLGCSTILLGQ